jgi:hypothetical protein
MTDVDRSLDELSPPRAAPDRWSEIVADAGPARRRALRPVVVAPFALAAAIAVLVLAWPFGGGPRGSVLDRAAAAIGDGPVLHAVIQSGWGGTQIDLAGGARQMIHGEDELWYDPQRGVHDISTFAGAVQGDALYPPGRVSYLDKTLALLASNYRHALQNGSARLLGEGEVDGRPVYWIRVDTQMLPDTSDGKLHEWAHDVAVSKDTLKPVAIRETRDGNLSPDGISRVESVESLRAGAGDFNAPASSNVRVGMRVERTGSLTVEEAKAVLGAPVLWAGPSVDGLKLARISRDTRSEGTTTHTGITLYYGPSSGGGIGTPPPSGPYLQISETLTLDDAFQRGVENYSPPEGTLLVFGKGIGVMQSHGVHLALEGSSEELLLAAARALEPRAP